ncbi:MAG: alcohol dehydrogenase catalytic domain-containing protein [Candidatus Marinimicrobia bacterium]|nr:alcohol dehydrogenase catalytic domain-containing protein [Candidatus Neomarinimicrobiota bacterium]
MKALVLSQPGHPPKLVLKDLPMPVPGPNEALVQVAACGFCHHDLLVMSGTLRRGVKEDVVLGHEIAGTVVEIGNEVASVAVGDRVVSLLTNACGSCTRCRQGREHRCLVGEGIGHGRDGGFAEFVKISAFSLIPVTGSLSLEEAALLACPLGVVVQGITEVAMLAPGETMVVTGAGGGLGVHAVQVGVALGARVLAVTSSPGKMTFLEGLGAEAVLEAGPQFRVAGSESGDSDDPALDFSELVRGFTDEQGADVIIDTVGSPLFQSCLSSLGAYGRWVLLGEVAGEPVRLNPAELIFRDARIMGSSGTSRAAVERAAGLVAQGLVRPVVQEVLPLEQAATAFELMAGRKILGRVVLSNYL